MTDQFSRSHWVCHIQVHLYVKALENPSPKHYMYEMSGILFVAFFAILQLVVTSQL